MVELEGFAPMIAVQKAVTAAFEFFHELYETGKFEDILLEEVALSDDRSAWRDRKSVV